MDRDLAGPTNHHNSYLQCYLRRSISHTSSMWLFMDYTYLKEQVLNLFCDFWVKTSGITLLIKYPWNHKLSSEQCRTCRAVRPCDIHVHLEMGVCMYWCPLGTLKFVSFRPCLIRPKVRSGLIMKPWSCKGKHWIQVLFHVNKCEIWIWFLSICRNLLSDENEFDQNVEFIQGYVPQPLRSNHRLWIDSNFKVSITTCPSLPAILNSINLPPKHLTVPTTHWSSTSHWLDDPLVYSP